MKKTIPIEKGIIMPEKKIRSTVYPFEGMEVGDSFMVYGKYTREKMQSIGVSINYHEKKFSGRKYSARKTEDNTIRVWRTE
jgi:hypothetical protein